MNFVIGYNVSFCCDYHLFVSLLFTFLSMSPLLSRKVSNLFFLIEERLGKVQTKSSLSAFSFPVMTKCTKPILLVQK